jgi:hypothetical protein
MPQCPGPCCPTGPPPPCGSVCFAFHDRCGNGLAGVVVTLTDINGIVSTCTTSTAGTCCCTVTGAGAFTFGYGAVTGYSGGSGSGTAICPGTVNVPTISPTPTTTDTPTTCPTGYIRLRCGCLDCVATGRRPSYVCKRLYASLSGGTVACDGSFNTIALDWDATSYDGSGTPPATWETRWKSGCQTLSGAKYHCTCIASFTCQHTPFPCPGDSPPVPVLILTSNPQYASWDLTLAVGFDGTSCYLSVTYNNYYNSGCTNVPTPTCATGPNGEAGSIHDTNPTTTGSADTEMANSCAIPGKPVCPYPTGYSTVVTTCNSHNYNTTLSGVSFPAGICGATNLSLGSFGPAHGSTLVVTE